MKKQIIILSSLFFGASLFLTPVQAELVFKFPVQTADLEMCPNPNSSTAPHEVLEVGDSCKVSSVETVNDKGKGYVNWGEGNFDVRWTLVKKDGNKKIWVANAAIAKNVFVGSVEKDGYTFDEAKEVCNRTEKVVLNGKTHLIYMVLPEIGFGRGTEVSSHAVDFELLRYLNYTSVISNAGQDAFQRFWSDTYEIPYAFVYHPANGSLGSFSLGLVRTSLVLCVGFGYRVVD